MRNLLQRLPAWAWLSIAVAMLTAGLWLAYFVVVDRPHLPFVDSNRRAEVTATSVAQSDIASPREATAEVVAGDENLDTPASEGDGTALVTEQEQAIDSTVAAEGTPTPVASAVAAMITVSPAPVLPAPATPAPDQRLTQGEALYRLGDYAAARAEYAALLASVAVPPQMRVRALYETAKSYLAEGFPSETLATLERLDDEVAPAPAAALSSENLDTRSEYLRAEALAALGRYDEAIVAYSSFLQSYPSTTVTVQPKMGRVYLTVGNVQAGDAAYRTAAEASSDVVHRVLLLEELARIHTDAARHGYAAAAYDSILDIARLPNYRAQILARAGHSYANSGDEATAIARWQAAIAEAKKIYQVEDGEDSADAAVTAAARSAAIDAAYDALVELVNRGVDFDLYERGIIDLEAEAYAPAAAAFSAYLDSVPADDARAAYALQGLGRSHLGAGDATTAQATFTRLLNEYPECPCSGEVQLDMAAAQALQGDAGGARQRYRTFARDNPEHPLAPEAMWRSGLSALNEGSDVEGAFDLLALADAFPASERAPEALFWVGTGAFRNGLFTESADAFSRLQRDYPDYRWDAVAYWLGRAQHEEGDTEGAAQTWSVLVSRAPDIYYGILAALSMRSMDLTGGSILTAMDAIAGPATRLEGDDGSQAVADRWVANWLGVDPALVSVLSAEVANHADLQAGRLLLDLDARGDAMEALQRVYNRYQDEPQTLYALSLEFERLGAFRLSLMAMSRVLQMSPANLVEDGPIFMQERVYPRPFAELITGQALAYNIDPLLLFSLIRQESLFEEGARSVASAQGLAQIIPDTGQWIAERLGYPNYSNDLVYRPRVNVRFGAYYLDWVRDYLDGNMVSALVGYNAGPGNAERWRELSGSDDVRFVEVLEMAEPRTYVKAIASNLYHYHRLYGEGNR